MGPYCYTAVCSVTNISTEQTATISRISRALVGAPHETTAQFCSAHSVPGRATGTFPRARRGRARMWVCVVDDAVGECERAYARRLEGVGRDVGAGHGREIAYANRVGCRAERAVVVFDAAGALLLLSDRGVEVVVEIAIQ